MNSFCWGVKLEKLKFALFVLKLFSFQFETSSVETFPPPVGLLQESVGDDAEDTAAPEVPPPVAETVAPVPAGRPYPAMLNMLMMRGLREDWSDERRTWEIQQLAVRALSIRERELLRLKGGTLNNWVRQEWGEHFFGGEF